jgi:hypothetical protein
VFASSGLARERREDLLGVGRPVGRDVQVAALAQPARERVHERGLSRRRLWWRFLCHGSGK